MLQCAWSGVDELSTVTDMGRPLRRQVALPVSIALVLALGLIGLLAGHSSGAKAEATHRADRLSLQLTLAGLAGQFAQIGAAEIRDIVAAQSRAGLTAWSGQPGDAGDARRLRQVAEGSRALSAGAVLVTVPGSASASYAPPGHVLPAATDAGWAPLRAAVVSRSGTVPVSGVLSAGDLHVIAIGVPVVLRSGDLGLLIGLSELRGGPLQRYVAGLPKDDGRMGYVIDARGLVIAGPTAAEVGGRLRWPTVLAAVRDDDDAIVDVTAGDTSYTTAYARAGSTGWTALTVQDTEAFVGPLRRSAHRAEWSMVLFLLIAGGVLVWLHRSRERALREAAVTDELTGLLNRRGWFAVAEHEVERARRAGERRGLLFVDIDGLKQINDELGHDSGDSAIRDAGAVFRQSFRQADVVSRIGGDEFVAYTLDDEQPDAILARIRANLRAFNLMQERTYAVTMSAGIVQCDPIGEQTLANYLLLADEQMYAQKRSRLH